MLVVTKLFLVVIIFSLGLTRMLPAVPPEARCIVILIVSVIAGIEVLK